MGDPSEPSFRVVDRRRFTESGEVRPDAEASQERPATATPKAPPTPPKTQAAPPPPKAAAGQTPPRARGNAGGIEFSHFVLSLATSAQMAMGMMSNPEAKVMHQDMAAARQTIDIIALLQDKTQGNLSPEEAQLIEEVLYTLRLQYVQVTKVTDK